MKHGFCAFEYIVEYGWSIWDLYKIGLHEGKSSVHNLVSY